MLLFLVLLSATRMDGPPTGSSANFMGFADADANAIQSHLRSEIEQCAASAVVDVPVPCDEYCVQRVLAATGLGFVVVMEALRVGSDVDVQERVFDGQGRLQHDSHRSVGASVFSNAALSNEACAILRPTPTIQNTTPTTTTTTTTPTPTTPTTTTPTTTTPTPTTTTPTTPTTTTKTLATGWWVAGAGGVVAVGGALLFAVQAGILEDPASAGADKERAALIATLGLGAVAVGIGVAGVGSAMGLNDF